MTTLSDLFPQGPRTDAGRPAPSDDHHTMRRLTQLIGEPRRVSQGVTVEKDVRALVASVEAAAANAQPVTAAAAVVTTATRPRRRTLDVLTVGLGSLAVIAVATAVAVGGVQMATASPAAGALSALRADEADLQNAQESLMGGVDRVRSSIEDEAADAAALRAVLLDTATAPDPMGEEGAVLEVADPAALTAVLGAMDAYQADLAAIDIPEPPVAFERGDLDERSLVEVGEAIDRVHEQLTTTDAALAHVRTVRARLDELSETLDAAVTAFAASYPAAAEAALERYPDTDEPLDDALTEAAAAVVAADLLSEAGRATLLTYRDALVELAEGQQEALRAREEEQARSRPITNPGAGAGEPTAEPIAPADQGTTDPGTGDTGVSPDDSGLP